MVKETFTHKTRVPKVDGGKEANFIRQVAENQKRIEEKKQPK